MMVCEKEDYLRQNMAKYESDQLTRLDYIKKVFKFLPVF
jgi:hypothetical protein